MKQIRKTNGILRSSLFFGLVLFMLFLMPHTVNAENVQGFVFFRFEEDGETYADLAVCVDTDSEEISFLTCTTGEEENYGSPRIDVSDRSFSLEYRGTYDNLISVWGCWERDILQYVDQYKVAYPVKGETATAVYVSESGESYDITRAQTCVQSSTEMENGSGRMLISFDEVDCEYIPGALENADGECIGIILKSTVGYPLQYDDFVFNNGSAAKTQTEQPAQNEPQKQTGEQTENQVEQGSEQKTNQIWLCVAAGGLAVVILAVMLIMRKKKRQKPELVTPPDTPPDVQPVPPIPPDFGPKTEWLAPTPPDSKSKIESPTPTQPVDSKLKPGKKQFFLYIKSGYMMGQAYPVGDDRILIGRHGKCRIRYPKDYAGISNIHASVFRLNGRIYLKDENSSYGTYLKTDVGAKQMNSSQPQELREGSEFYLAEKKNMIQLISTAVK